MLVKPAGRFSPPAPGLWRLTVKEAPRCRPWRHPPDLRGQQPIPLADCSLAVQQLCSQPCSSLAWIFAACHVAAVAACAREDCSLSACRLQWHPGHPYLSPPSGGGCRAPHLPATAPPHFGRPSSPTPLRSARAGRLGDDSIRQHNRYCILNSSLGGSRHPHVSSTNCV